VILTGGLHDPESVLRAYEHTGVEAVMLARGSMGNPWLFEQLLGLRAADVAPSMAEILDELEWTIDRCVEHLGAERAGRWLRKCYPWYVDRMGLDAVDAKRLQAALQQADGVDGARAVLAPLHAVPVAV
jgi:tRNA-dihydrouridine synthase B